MGHAGESLSLWDSDRKKPRLLISFPLKHRFPTDVLSSGFFHDLSEALSLVSSASFIHHLPVDNWKFVPSGRQASVLTFPITCDNCKSDLFFHEFGFLFCFLDSTHK